MGSEKKTAQERRHGEDAFQAVKESKERLSLAQRLAGAGVWDWDIPTGKLNWSKELFELFGLDPDKAGASFDSWRSILHPDDLKGAEEHIDAAVKEHKQLNSEYRIIMPSGAIRWINALGNTVYDASGKPLRMTGICLDVSARKQVEEALQISEKRFRDVVESMDEYVWEMDVSGVNSYVSPAVERILGYKPEEMIGKTPYDMWDPAERDRLTQEAFAILSTQKPFKGFINVNRHRDGHKVFIESSGVPMFDSKGMLVGYRGIDRDITEDKKVEGVLRESEAHLNSIFKSAPAGMGVAVNRIFQGANDRMCEITGYSREELLGKNSRFLYPSEEDYKYVGRELYGVIEKGGVGEAETRFRRKDGRIINVYIRAASLIPGKPLAGMSFTILDITDRKKAEDALRESAERFRAYMTASSDVVYRMSPDWKEMRHLQGKEFIPDTDSPSGTWLDKYIHPDDQEHVLSVIKEAIRTKSVFELEHRILRVDGTLGWTRSRAIPLLDEKGKIVEWFGAASDITERKKAEEELRESEEKYWVLFDSIDEGYCIVEVLFDKSGKASDYRFLETNRAFEKQTGLFDARGQTMRTLRPKHEEHWFEIYGRIAKTGEPMRFQNEAAELGRFYDVYAFRIGDPGERRVAILFNDISKHKRAEEALRETKEYLENLLNYANAPIIVWDSSCRITRFNRAFERLTGLATGDVVGKRLDILFPKDGIEGSMKLIKRTMAGEPWETVEIPVLHSGGPVRTVLWNSANICDRDGKKVIATIAQGQDITEMLEAERELQSSETSFRSLFEDAPVATWEIDYSWLARRAEELKAEGVRDVKEHLSKNPQEVAKMLSMLNVVNVNKECLRLFGEKNRRDLIKNYARHLTTERMEPVRTELYAALVGGRKRFVRESVIRTVKGTVKPIILSVSVAPGSGKDLSRVFVSFLDITERKKAEEVMRKSIQEKDALLQEVHHRVKNNMQMISSLMRLQSRSTGEKCADEVFRQSRDRINSIALIHERLYRSEDHMHIDLEKYVTDLAENLYRSHGVDRKRISFNADVEDVGLDMDKLIYFGLIINEIVSNSLKHAFPGNAKGTISIRLRERGSCVRLQVGDDGCGLPEERPRKGDTLGLRLISDIANNQLGGTLRTTGQRGTKYYISFRR